MTHHRPGWQQTHIRLAAGSSSRRDHSKYAAAQVASLILGGNFSSRINIALRERYGLAYRTLVSLSDHLEEDVLIVEADVNSSSTAEGMSHLTRLMEEFASTGATGRELAAAVGYVLGRYALSLGSQSGRAACLLSYLTAGIPLSGIEEIPERIAGLALSDVQEAAALHHPDRMSGVVCGDATELPDVWL